MASPVIVDLRNIYRPDEMIAHGFVYHSVGRSSPTKEHPSSGEIRPEKVEDSGLDD